LLQALSLLTHLRSQALQLLSFLHCFTRSLVILLWQLVLHP
jgi:hypothetical protein